MRKNSRDPRDPAFLPGGPDAVSWLCAFVVLLLALPSSLVVGQLGGVGAPANLVGLAAFLWWCWHHLHRTRPNDISTQPVRWAVFLLLGIVLVSYVWAMMRPIPADEVSPADASILRLISLLGITLVANDGIRSTARMHVLVRYLITGALAMAVLSIFQFVTGRLWVDRISIPGLSQSADLSLDARSGLVRPSATAISAIEFAALVSMIVPIAVMNLRSRTGIGVRHWLVPGTMVLGLMLSISRTGILCLIAGLLVITPALPRRWRIIGAAGATVMIVVVGLTVPGLVGTIRGLFTGLEVDPSVQSRTGSYALALQFIERHPLLGSGLGTFLPKYWIMDNMYLQFTIETGVLGIVTLLALFVTAVVTARRAARLFPEGRERDLAIGLTGGITAGAVSFAFFDALSFPQAACTLFLLMGMGGAYWRIARQMSQEGHLVEPDREGISLPPSLARSNRSHAR